MKPIAASAHAATMMSTRSPEESPSAAECDTVLASTETGAPRAALPEAARERWGALPRAAVPLVLETRVGVLWLWTVPPPVPAFVTVAGAVGPVGGRRPSTSRPLPMSGVLRVSAGWAVCLFGVAAHRAIGPVSAVMHRAGWGPPGAWGASPSGTAGTELPAVSPGSHARWGNS